MRKTLEVPKRDFEPGQTHEGFLVSTGVNEMPSDTKPGEFNKRPMLIMSDKETGELFKVFLGKAAMDVLPLLENGAYTWVTKDKVLSGGTGPSHKGGYYQYKVDQDPEKTVKGQE